MLVLLSSRLRGHFVIALALVVLSIHLTASSVASNIGHHVHETESVWSGRVRLLHEQRGQVWLLHVAGGLESRWWSYIRRLLLLLVSRILRSELVEINESMCLTLLSRRNLLRCCRLGESCGLRKYR